MYKVGAVNIDTSHPIEFAKIMQQLGRAQYHGVYNSGFRSKAYVEKFMKDNSIVSLYDNLKTMAEEVDIAFIHGCNWDKHLELAMPFINAGKPVFIDKPIVGNLQDCNKVEQLVKQGAIILGASSFRYCYEFQNFNNKSEMERGNILSLIGTIGVDEFNYGVHIVEALGSFVPNNAQQVRCIYDGPVIIYQVEYENDVNAIFQLCPGIWRPASLVITTTTGTTTIEPATNKLYEALLNYIFDVLDKKRPITPISGILESIKILIAAKQSHKQKGRRVFLSELSTGDIGYDGLAFEEYYAKANS